MNAVRAPACTEHYEALRQNAVTREPIFSTAPLGAVLVVKSGVAGWMRRWGQVCSETNRSSPLLPAANEPNLHRELAMLLAAMTAPHLRSTSS